MGGFDKKHFPHFPHPIGAWHKKAKKRCTTQGSISANLSISDKSDDLRSHTLRSCRYSGDRAQYAPIRVMGDQSLSWLHPEVVLEKMARMGLGHRCIPCISHRSWPSAWKSWQRLPRHPRTCVSSVVTFIIQGLTLHHSSSVQGGSAQDSPISNSFRRVSNSSTTEFPLPSLLRTHEGKHGKPLLQGTSNLSQVRCVDHPELHAMMVYLTGGGQCALGILPGLHSCVSLTSGMLSCMHLVPGRWCQLRAIRALQRPSPPPLKQPRFR